MPAFRFLVSLTMAMCIVIQFGLLLSLGLRFAFFVLVAFYSNDPDNNRDILAALHDFNDLVGIVVLSVIMVFVAVVVDRLGNYWSVLV